MFKKIFFLISALGSFLIFFPAFSSESEEVTILPVLKAMIIVENENPEEYVNLKIYEDSKSKQPLFSTTLDPKGGKNSSINLSNVAGINNRSIIKYFSTTASKLSQILTQIIKPIKIHEIKLNQSYFIVDEIALIKINGPKMSIHHESIQDEPLSD